MGRQVGKLWPFPYRITIWTKDGQNLIRDVGGMEHFICAHAAWEAAVAAYPNDMVCLQEGVRLIKQSDRQG